MSKSDPTSATVFNLKGYINAESRRDAARLYLNHKSNIADMGEGGSHMFETLVKRLSVRMGKVTSLRKRIIAQAQAILDGFEKATEQLVDNAEVETLQTSEIAEIHAAETGQNTDNVLNETSANPYEEGVTGGFSLFGAGRSYMRLALKGCAECQGLYRHRSGQVNHNNDCSNYGNKNFEPQWFENPRIHEQDGRYIQFDNGTSILALVAQEEEEMLGDRQTNGSLCEDDNHVVILVPKVNPGGFVSLTAATDELGNKQLVPELKKRYMVERMYKGEPQLRPCNRCNGTNTVYPTCRMCNGTQKLTYTKTEMSMEFDQDLQREVETYGETPIDIEDCPMCKFTSGRMINITGSSSDANRQTQAMLLQQARRDAEWTNIGLDFVEFIGNSMRVLQAQKIRDENNELFDRKVDLLKKFKTDGLTKEEKKELDDIGEVRRYNDMDAWRTMILMATEAAELDLEWLWVENGVPHQRVNSSMLEAMDRLLQWGLNPNSVAIAGTIGRPMDELMLILPENLYAGDPWGPYMLERELGDAELMVNDASLQYMHAMDVYPLNESPKFNVIFDDVTGYNPGRDLSERASQNAQMDTIVELVLPVITNPKATMQEYFELVQQLKSFRRPRKLTVGEFLGNNPEFLKGKPKSMAFMDENMFRANTGDSDKPTRMAGFFHGDKFVQLKLTPNEDDVKAIKEAAEKVFTNNKKRREFVKAKVAKLPRKWATQVHKNYWGVDGISCWKTANISEEGVNNALALIGKVMLKRKITREGLMGRRHVGADQLVKMELPELAETYRAMAFAFQWLPHDYDTNRLPDLAYFKWETEGLMSRAWGSVPSRITDGAVNNFIKSWCQDKGIRWTSYKEGGGRYPKTHIMPEDGQYNKECSKAVDNWRNDNEQKLMEALTQFQDRMANMANRWRPIITEWMKDRKKAEALLGEWGCEGRSMRHRDDFDTMMGTPHEGPRVYGGTNTALQFTNNLRPEPKKLKDEDFGGIVGEFWGEVIGHIMKATDPIEFPTIPWSVVKEQGAKPGHIIVHG